MKAFLLKSVIFVLFVVLVVVLSLNSDRKEAQKQPMATHLSEALNLARNELILVLGEDSTLKSQIKNLSLAYTGCSSKASLEVLPDFILDKSTGVIDVCNVSVLEQGGEFSQRVVYEFFTAHDLCSNISSEIVERVCEDRDKNERYQVDRMVASTGKSDTNYFTLNVDYGDKSSVFMIVKGSQTKLAYKTNYGDQSLVALEDEDIVYLESQINKIQRKFAKPKCNRKVMRLFARNKNGQRFRSFACVEDINAHTQKLLKLTRTVTSLSKNTF